MGLANGKLSYWEEKEKRDQERVAEAEKRLKEDTGREEEEKKWWQALKAKPTLEERQKEIYEELGIEPKEYYEARAAARADVSGMMTEYNKIESQRDAAIAQQEARPGADIAFQSREVQNIRNKYNIELQRMSSGINTKLSIMSMEEGDFNSARSFAKEAVANYTFDLKLEFDKFSLFKEENAGLIDELEQDYKNALDEAENTRYNTWKETETEKTNVMNLMLENRTAGITIEDTLEEAVKKVSEMPEAPELLSVAEAKSLGVPYGTTKQEAIGIVPGVPTGKDAARMVEINKLLQTARLESYTTPQGLPASRPRTLTASDYQSMIQLWIGMDGTKADFLASYPPESLLSADEVSKISPAVYSPTTDVLERLLSGTPGLGWDFSY